MNYPSAIEVILGHRPDPFEPRFIKLPDAVANGSRFLSNYNRTEFTWTGLNTQPVGYHGLRQVLGYEAGLIYKERLLFALDSNEGNMDVMIPSSKLPSTATRKKTSATNQIPDIDKQEQMSYKRKENGGR